MKKMIFIMVVFAFGPGLHAQNGRPAKIGDNAPVITAGNSLDKEVITLGERLNAIEKRMASLETENAALKSENAAQQKLITEIAGAQKANYYVLNDAFTKLNTRFNAQVGDFIIKGLAENNKLPPLDQHILLGIRK